MQMHIQPERTILFILFFSMSDNFCDKLGILIKLVTKNSKLVLDAFRCSPHSQ